MGELLERDGELAALGAAAAQAAAGHGRVVTVVAPAGGGKTLLLREAERLAREAGLTTLHATATELTRQVPFALAQELLAPALRDASARARLLRGRGSAAAGLFGEPPADAGAAEIVLALAWVIAVLADDGPLALLVDDAQWADRGTLDLLAHVATRVDDEPLLLVVATRPAVDPGDERLALGGEALEPAVLSAQAAAQLLRARLGRTVAVPFADACHEATGGNPFYLDELAATLAAEGIRPESAAAERVRALGTSTIARAVLVRLAQLPAGASAVAHAVAILGDGTPTAHVAALARVSRDDAETALAALARAAILADVAPPAYRHPIVRASVLGDLTASERAGWHWRAAAVLRDAGVEASRIASHLLECEPSDGWAAVVLREAAVSARERGSPALAARLLGRVAPTFDVQLELGTAMFEAGEAGALEYLAAARDSATTAEECARAAIASASPLAAGGQAKEAIALLSTAADALAQDEPLRTEVDATLAAIGLLDGGAVAAVVDSLSGRAALPTDGPAGRRMLAHFAQCIAMTGVSAQEAAAYALRAVDGGALVAEAGPASPAVAWAANVLIAADRFSEADEHLAAALHAARRRGSVGGFVVASMMRSLSAYRQGDLDAAVAEARSATDVALEHGWGPGLPATTGFLVDALIERGELDAAAAALARAGVEDEHAGSIVVNAFLVARGRLKLAAGDLRGGVADLLELGGRSEREGFSTTIGAPTFRTYAAPALGALGDAADARALAEEELAIARAWGAPRAIGIALRVAGVVDGGTDALEEAVAVLAGTRARLEHARALADLGAARRRAGMAAQAREPLRAAAAIAIDCRAAPLLAFAREELAATGARRVDRTLLRGVDALTPSERRVAQLAAEGLSNREIAQALFLTRKTIEMHLGRAYRKLDIASREQLAGALGDA